MNFTIFVFNVFCINAEKMPRKRLEHISPLYHKNTTQLILAAGDDVNFDFEMYLGIIHPELEKA